MESDSKPPSSLNPPPSVFADFLGSAIAMLTLIIPLLVIVRYSATQASAYSPAPYTIQQLDRNLE
ncbi:MAG: hypothetical protein WBA13_19275 [Microcoleaceae cyanobacterium]